MENNKYKDLLIEVSKGNRISAKNEIKLKEGFKKIFYGDQGYMAWRKNMESKSGSFQDDRRKFLNEYIKQNNNLSASLFVEGSFQRIYELALEHLNSRLYGVVDNFVLWGEDSRFSLTGEVKMLYLTICQILTTTSQERDRVILLLGVYAEGSLSQARKSLAGSGGELIVAGLLQANGFKKGVDFGTQFRSEGSDTDIVIPFASCAEQVKAFIAIQVSSNDRTRLTTSELVSGKNNYFISFNGCSASSKNTDDIGDEIISKYIKEDIIYVVTEKELNRARETATNKFKKDPNDYTRNRVIWLTTKCITFETFVEQVALLK